MILLRELEVKVLTIDIDDIISKLESKGADKVAEEIQLNTVLDTKDYYIETHINGYLRIRSLVNTLTREKKSVLTLKKKISDKNVRESIEIETEINDHESMIRIMEELGLTVLYENTKKRTSYLYNDVRFDIDIWDEELGIKPYLEIEVPSEERLEQIINEFDIDRKYVSTKSIKELLEERDGK